MTTCSGEVLSCCALKGQLGAGGMGLGCCAGQTMTNVHNQPSYVHCLFSSSVSQWIMPFARCPLRLPVYYLIDL